LAQSPLDSFQCPEGNHGNAARLTKPFREGHFMSIKTSLTRRQALMLSSAAAAGVALGSLPRVARELADIGI
jgi:hypothetical protein